MTGENICRTMVVPKNSKNVDTVKDFLKYLASDRAQKLSAQNANGLNMLPFGYVPTEEDMGFEMDDYVKSINAKNTDNVIIDFSNLAYDFASATKLNWYYDMNTGSGTLATTMFAGKATAPADIYKARVFSSLTVLRRDVIALMTGILLAVISCFSMIPSSKRSATSVSIHAPVYNTATFVRFMP